MIPVKVGLYVFIVLAVLLVACGTAPVSTDTQGSATSQPGAPLDGQALLEVRCTKCHTLSRVARQHLSLDEWNALVARMVNNGAEVNASEQQILVDYLSATYGP